MRFDRYTTRGYRISRLGLLNTERNIKRAKSPESGPGTGFNRFVYSSKCISEKSSTSRKPAEI